MTRFFLAQRQFLFGFLFSILFIVVAVGCGGDSNNNENTGDGSIDTADNIAPTASLTVSIASGEAPLAVVFDGTASSDSDGAITGYEWVFGDGETGQGSNITHTYEEVGVFTAELTVTDDDGSTDTVSRQISVTAPANISPEASFKVSTANGIAPLTVTFDASDSWDRDGAIAAYTWDFGDGSTDSGVFVQKTFSSTGSYRVVLTVTDDDGMTDTAFRAIVVHPSNSSTYTISGTVTSAENVATDSDVNDIFSTPVSNNSFNNAQEIAAPVTVSGYVNVAHAGSRGVSYNQGDREDYFLVSLTEGMVVSLYMVEEPLYAELNLYLYDSQRILRDATSTDGEIGVASLTVPSDGDYYVRVQAASGFFLRTATVYALTVGLSTSATDSSGYPLRLSDDFVPGEVLVRFQASSGSTVSAFSSGSTEVSSMGFQTKGGRGSRDKLLRRSDTIDSDTFFDTLGVQSEVERSLSVGSMDSETLAKMETLWMVRAMRNQSGVLMAQPNYIRKPLMVPDDDYYSYQWHYPLINLPDAWNLTTGSTDVVVAVVDTGVLLEHPDLSGQLLEGYDFVSDDDISLDDEPGIDSNPDDPGDQADIGGSSFHGTHVAGTIAALTNNNDGEGGVAGIAWNAKILPVRALGYGGGTTYDIMQAVKYAAGLENDSGIILDDPADIINLSLGSESASPFEKSVYTEARNQGVIIVAAAGNSGTGEKMYPAAYDGVVSVSAVTISKSFASYSNYGETVDVAAPGGSSTDTNGDGYADGVLSTIGDDSGGEIEMGYAFSIGTSMAAPHVAGVIALMKSLYPDMTPDEFDALLEAGYLTQDLGDSNWDQKYGWGLIDAYKAVLVAKEGGESGGIPAILSVSPSNLSFNTALSDTLIAEVAVENIGGDTELAVTGVYADSSWISIDSTDVDANGLGAYRVTVNPEDLSDGIYTGAVTFESDNQSSEVSVIIRVGEVSGTTDGGYHYILLLDPETYESIGQVDGSGEGGIYEFSFSGLSYGDTYVIFAGTDPNNDNFICDDGEACGAYLSLDKPVTLTVLGDMEGINFSTDINMTLPTVTTSRFAEAGLPFQLKTYRKVEQ